MTDIEALVTAARHYCYEQATKWGWKYGEQRSGTNIPYDYSDNDYDLFPRYLVLWAILHEIEVFVGIQDVQLELLREQLANAGRIAADPMTNNLSNPIALNAMRDERGKFVSFIQSVSVSELNEIEPLGYNRRLRVEESDEVRQNLKVKWNFEGEWEPLHHVLQPSIFLATDELTSDDHIYVRRFIQESTNDRFYMLHENLLDYEVQTSFFEFHAYETVYCPKDFSWIVYFSHEGTIAFGGAELISLVRKLFVDRMDAINKWPELQQ